MTGERVERRLAAVLAADVAGYSRLMGADEEGTLARLKAVRKAFVDPALASHRGRIVKTTGDGMLVEFASAVDAARGSVEIQRAMAAQNADVPQNIRIEFRIGIHVGDIIIDDNDIFGDGVNIAARLEGIAEPGGVCISDDAYRQVRGKVEIGFDDIGQQNLKNIAEPMRAWRVQFDGQSVAKPQPDSHGHRTPSLSLSLKPSVAVLPFQNMSGDSEQEYFADGIVEDIITALSRFKSLFVIARNSSFTYKGKAVDMKMVGRDLGVKYVLEGSVRKAGGRLRVTAQLIDATSGGHVWAERYEGSAEDVFGLQDQITSDVVGAIAPSLEMAEIDRSRISPTDSPVAYDYYFRGLWHAYRRTRNSIDAAEIAFSKAADLDSNFALAISWLATCCVIRKAQEWMLDKDRETLEGLRLARQSIAMSKDDAVVLAGSGYALAYLGGEFDLGNSLLDRSLALNPNFGRGWSLSGWIRLYVGEPDLAIERQLKAMRLSPLDPQTHNMITCIATAHFLADRYDESIASAQRALHLEPNWLPAHRMLVLANALEGRIDESQQALKSLLLLNPDETSVPFPFKSQEYREKWRAGFRIAGLEK